MRLVVAASAALMLLLVPSSAPAAFAPVNQKGPALTVPADQLAASLACTPGVQNATQEPVLLLPATGVNSQDNFSWNYEKALTQMGIPYCTSDQPGEANSNLGDIQVRGQFVTYAIRQVAAMAGRPIAVAGHSQGGMVMRWSLRFWPDTRPLVADVMGFAGSNHGTTVGTAADCQAAGGCPPAAWQQLSSANFIKALNSRQETFAGIDYTEIYTHNDQVVRPNSDSNGSSSVHGPGNIANVAVQDVCPGDSSDHLLVGTTDPVTWALFLDALTHAGPADPARIDPAVCSQSFMPGVDPSTFITDAGTAGAHLSAAEQSYPRVAAEPKLACYVTSSCAPPGGARLRIALAPRHVPAGRSVTIKVRVRAKLSGRLQPVRGAAVRVAGHRGRTNSHGRTKLRLNLSPGSHRLRATLKGFKPGTAHLLARG
jgi:hypothetical protein